MKKDMFSIRRRMAVSSFVVIVLTLFAVILGAIFGSESAGKNLLSIASIVSPIILCLAGIIGQYAHLVYKIDSEAVKSEN